MHRLVLNRQRPRWDRLYRANIRSLAEPSLNPVSQPFPQDQSRQRGSTGSHSVCRGVLATLCGGRGRRVRPKRPLGGTAFSLAIREITGGASSSAWLGHRNLLTRKPVDPEAPVQHGCGAAVACWDLEAFAGSGGELCGPFDGRFLCDSSRR